MEFNAIARDRLYRRLEPLVGAEEADYLMASLAPGGWAEVATKSDLGELGSSLRGEMAELRSELRTDLAEFRAEVRSEMVTRTELREQLQLHVDARIGAISRTWFFGTMAMQAATIGGIIAAIRL